MKKLENILAENLLRFSAKNLSEDVKKKLVEQTNVKPATNLTKYTGVDVWLDNLFKVNKASMQPNAVYAGKAGNYVVNYKTSDKKEAGFGAGTLRVYSVTTVAGWPILRAEAVLTNRIGTDWRKSGNDSLTTINMPIDFKSIPGNTSPEKFNTYWLNPEQYISGDQTLVSADFTSACISVITDQQQNFQELFKANNSNNPVSKQPYSAEAGTPFSRTQYYIMIDSKVTNKTARVIYNLIKDPELISALTKPTV
jgi:hypothetical protein